MKKKLTFGKLLLSENAHGKPRIKMKVKILCARFFLK